MGWTEWLSRFYQKACADNRLSPAHISLYFALAHEVGHVYAIPFYLRRETIMLKAKIYLPVTLNRCLREVHEYGYIEYRPSYTPGQSAVMLAALE